MKMNTYEANHLRCLVGTWWKQVFNTEIVPLLEVKNVGYKGCCPGPALRCVLVRRAKGGFQLFPLAHSAPG